MSDLIELQRAYFLNLINEIQTEHNVKFLVIDEQVETLLSYIFESPQQLLRHVTAVDRIDSPNRKGQPSVEVIYLLKPTKFNINCIDVDFCNRPPKYKKCHIRFLPESEPHIMRFFGSKKYIPQYMATINEAKLSFIPKQSQVFLTSDIDKPLQIFFNKQCSNLIDKNLQKMLQSLLNLCIITGEYPIIRYSKPSQDQFSLAPGTALAKRLAYDFQSLLDGYARENNDFPPPSSRPRSILVITDRALDPFSPLLHDFSYQAMAYDAVPELDIGNDTYYYKAENEKCEIEEKTAKLLDILDPDLLELKNQHIVDASEYLSGKIKEMIAKNPLLVDRSNVKTTTDLLSVVAHLKDFDEERRRLILHRCLIDRCLEINQERKLAHAADLEQCLAGFGLDSDGERFKHITDAFLQILANKSSTVTDKIRYIIIYALYRGGIIEQDFMKLLSFIGIEPEHEFFGHFMRLFKNFEQIGFKLIKEEPRSKAFKRQWFHDTVTKDPSVYNSSRFIPAAGNILSRLITNPLLVDEESFPYVKDKPIELINEDAQESSNSLAGTNGSSSLRNPRHRAVWTKNSSSLKRAPRQRFMYYIIGGLTYPEIKAACDQSDLKNKDVFIGSEGIITPLSFMKSVEHLTTNRNMLNLKDDQPQKEAVPAYLYESVAPAAKPVSHMHVRSHNEPPKSAPVQINKPPVEKEKKKGKLSRFLKSRDKT
ncbi:hypothetical protein HG536_0C01050 [Torulaspora globosa]|uniref:Uncharacterized protein n=1 Tax=Torulaspora globosa TaxID=48254 RepID=A0A7G3ZEK2_9SACH|nr:uncharacterized protein HG536_0C01050 [Torulaspora globosa]QLL31938.1 hypothetical protein HG536_0C01050 [Torulaspora globosa]